MSGTLTEGRKGSKKRKERNRVKPVDVSEASRTRADLEKETVSRRHEMQLWSLAGLIAGKDETTKPIK